jgi:ribosomal protein L40E
MATDATTCPSCGAHVPSGHHRCELCGTPVSHESDDDRTEAEATPGTQPAAPEGEGASADDSPTEPSAEESSAEESSAEESSAEASRPEESPAEAPAGGGVYCNQCGWQNPEGANFCSRCGSELQKVEGVSAPDGTRRVTADLPSGEPNASGGEAASAQEESPQEESPQAGGEDAAAAEDEEQQLMGQQLTMVVGTALLVVIGLFFVTLWSQSQSWGSGSGNGSGDASGSAPAQVPAPGGGGAQSGPAQPGGSGSPTGGTGAGIQRQDLSGLADSTSGEMPSSIRRDVDSLRTRLEEVSGVRARRTKAQLVNLYVGAGQVGRAAVLQQEIARSAGDVDEWQRAANLLYKWMQQLSSEDSRQKAFQVASQAALAYEKVVAEKPDDLDARTRMGETYLLTNNPMKGIEAINGVLEDDSTFVPARFQKGLALLQINRLDQAISQFEKVKQYADEGSGFYQQADRAIRIINERSGSGGGGEIGETGKR